MMASKLYSRLSVAAERPDLATEIARFERLLDEQRDFLEVEGLVDVMVRAELHRLDRILHGGKGRHEDDERVW